MVLTHILLVEDEPMIARDIERRLTLLGYAVVATVDSAEAIMTVLKQTRPDLVLMDVQLQGGVNGIEIAADLWDQFNLPIVFLTAYADDAVFEQAKAIQPFGFIVKPFEAQDLRMAIEIALCRYRTEQATQAALKREKELNDLKSRFISVVSHEFRNPLSSLLFSLELLERQDLDLNPSKQKYFSRARSSIHRMNQLLEDVLLASEGESKQLSYQPVPMDVLAFCQDLVEEFQLGVGAAHRLRFTAHDFQSSSWKSGDSEPDAPSSPNLVDSYRLVNLDARLLRHILANLLSNAVKYSPEGSEIQFELLCYPETLSFRIQDQGIGIPMQDQAQLFNAFHRGSNVKHAPGTGLGLSIVKQCVDAHQGEITFSSQEGLGTTFTVTLRYEIAAPASMEQICGYS